MPAVIIFPKRRLSVEEIAFFFAPRRISVNAKIPGLNVAARSRGITVKSIGVT